MIGINLPHIGSGDAVSAEELHLRFERDAAAISGAASGLASVIQLSHTKLPHWLALLTHVVEAQKVHAARIVKAETVG